MGERVISFNFDKKQAIVLCKKAISSKMTIIRDGGDALQCGAPPDITFNVLIKDREVKISDGGPGAFLAETAANEIERVFQEYQRNPGAAVQQRRAPQQAVQAQTPFEHSENERDVMTPEQYLAMLSKGGDDRKEEKPVSNNQSTPIASPQTVREEPSNSNVVEEPADFSNELAMESISNGSAKMQKLQNVREWFAFLKLSAWLSF